MGHETTFLKALAILAGGGGIGKDNPQPRWPKAMNCLSPRVTDGRSFCSECNNGVCAFGLADDLWN